MQLGSDIQSSGSATLLCSPDSAGHLASGDSIGARFERMAARFPEKLAIKVEDETLNYRQLNERANRIAHTLLANHGSCPSRVALLFDQGADAIAAMLGVLKSGHSFVPLDSADPLARLQTVLRDCQPAILLTEERHAALASQLCGDDLVVLNSSRFSADVQDHNPDVSVAPESLAYLFYTSGSTGQPKGVCQTHRNLLHYIACYGGTLSITHKDRLTLLYSLSFSASNMDVFGALLNGATLCLYDIRRRGMAGLADWLEEEGIKILHAVPTVYRHLLQGMNPKRRFSAIRAVDLGGETVHASDVKLHGEHFGDECPLINHLAATEISVIAQCRVDQKTNPDCDALPVGRPAPKTLIRLLREDGAEADILEPGEMVIHSPFLSPGYWQRPDLNAATFADDPERSGWRIYYSRDLGYFDSDGNLYFLGRKDLRVKIRGHSVDTAEVEAALRQTSWIRNVAVVAQQNGSEGESKRLVAFLQAEQHYHSQLLDLRRSLQKQLPGYMIPSEFVLLDSLPLTTSGKVDRNALVHLERHANADNCGGDNPVELELGELERIIAKWFREILRQKTVSRSDDFFLLGGDSLKATQLHLHLQDSLGLRIPLEQLFQDPTVGGMADFLRCLQLSSKDQKAEHPPAMIGLHETGHKPKLFLVHGNFGQAFVSPHFLKILGEDQPVYAFQAMGLDRSRVPCNTIEDMAAQYVRAMRKVQPAGPYFLGSLCVGIVVALEMAGQLTEAGEVVGPLLLIDPPITPPGHYSWIRRSVRTLRARFRRFVFRATVDPKILRRLRGVKNKGRIAIDTENLQSVKEAADAAYHFRLALLKHCVKPYQGPVLLLRSQGHGASVRKLNYPLKGDMRVWGVEGKHRQLHDVNNADFTRQLQDCMKVAWEAFDVTAPKSRAPLP